MGQKGSKSVEKFQYVDVREPEQNTLKPSAVQKTSLQYINNRHSSKSIEGPIEGATGQFTGLTDFIIPEKYTKIMKECILLSKILVPLDCSKPNITGNGIFNPFMFRKSLNVYYGEWKNNQPHGYGKIYNPDKDYYYQGYFEDGLPSYYGVFLAKDIQYRGQIKLGCAEGKGKYTEINTTIQGIFKENYPFKNCVQKQLNQYEFYGDYQNGRFRKGKLIFNNQLSSYQGEFLNGLMHGIGILKIPEYIYKGHFQNGNKNGQGQIIWKSEEIYQGIFQDDEITGQGKYYVKNKLIFKGQFLEGKASGEGALIEGGKQIYANWNNGQAQQLI